MKKWFEIGRKGKKCFWAKAYIVQNLAVERVESFFWAKLFGQNEMESYICGDV